MNETKADQYNTEQIAEHALEPLHVTELALLAQTALGLDADGMCGPKTRAALEAQRQARHPVVVPLPDLAPLHIDADGWLEGEGVLRMPCHNSWLPKLESSRARRGGQDSPLAIVAHYTATAHGTGRNMARRREQALTPEDRVASWHVTLEGDGTIIQMVPFTRGAWHVRVNCPPIAGAGLASYVAVGVEICGYGHEFPPEQVEAAMRLWGALVESYSIPPAHRMVTHAELDPERRNDPGAVWMKQHAPTVLRYAELPHP